MNKSLPILLIVLLVSLVSIADTDKTSDKINLGKMLYFDNNLSWNKTQSCATCHLPAAGFIDPRDNGVAGMASLGDDKTSLGDRNTPTVAYTIFTPEFHFDSTKDEYIGGQFWDGRAKGLSEQAGEPPLNPAEMAMPNKQAVVSRLQQNSLYRQLFIQLFGTQIWQKAENAYTAMTQAIAAYEASPEVSPFDSKYDLYLIGKYELTDQEELGMALFFSNNNTNCNSCHMLRKPEQPQETFSNYQFHNIGVPGNLFLRSRNSKDTDTIDPGLLANPQVTGSEHLGKFKVPTLRNVAITGPYMHNGIFTKLSTVLAFYDKFNNSKRKLNPETDRPWRPAEVADTVNHELLQTKALSDAKLAALEAFLITLTDKRYEHLIDNQP